METNHMNTHSMNTIKLRSKSRFSRSWLLGSYQRLPPLTAAKNM
jgi:hypothetical protein